ncbi:MAG: carboxymuconolactone decarboxylase family protein [Novosphingobium sp.]
MAQITGQPQRIAPLAENELNDDALEISRKLRLAFGIPEDGEVPELLRTMLRHPGLFKVQMDMGMELAGKGAIPPRDREIAVLRNAWLIGAPYEWGEHVDLAKRYGMTAEEVARTITGSSAPEWTEHEAAICKGVEELQADAMISDATWAVLAKTWDETQLMEFPILVGQYTSTAFLQNSVRVRLAEDNPGLSHR